MSVEQGKMIRNARIKARLTMYDVSKATGFSVPYICDVELGRRNVSENFINKVSKLVKADWSVILFDQMQKAKEEYEKLKSEYEKVRPSGK